jgi:hypothetical protein
MGVVKFSARLALGLVLVTVLAGVAYVAMAQSSSPTNTAAVAEYEKQLKALDHNNVDDIFKLAKFCYRNGLNAECKTLALEILQKQPDDMRAKYLLYILTSGPEKTDVIVERPTVEAAAGISDEETNAIFTRDAEGLKTFSATQRLLITSCGNRKCHGGQNPAAKWSLVGLGDTSNRKTLAENFRTVNRYIDRENPAESKLFKMPTEGKKAGHPEIILRGTTDPVYIKLLQWVKTLKTSTASIWDEAAKSPPPPPPETSKTPTAGKP